MRQPSHRFLFAGILLVTCTFVPFAVSGQIQIQTEESSVTMKRFTGVDVSGDTEICEGAETTLQVEGEYESYSWSTGSEKRSITVKKAGIYEVTVTTKSGCSFTTSVNVRTKICT